MGVGAGHLARRAGFSTANFTRSKSVQQQLAWLTKRFHADDLTAKTTEFKQPRAKIAWKLLIQFLAQTLRKRGAFTRGRDGNLQVAAPDDRREIVVAIRWIIHCINEDVLTLCFGKHGTIDFGNVCAGNYEEAAVDVALSEGAEMKCKSTFRGEFVDAGKRIKRHYRHVSLSFKQTQNLALGDVTGAYNEAAATGEFKKNWKETHTARPSTYVRWNGTGGQVARDGRYNGSGELVSKLFVAVPGKIGA